MHLRKKKKLKKKTFALTQLSKNNKPTKNNRLPEGHNSGVVRRRNTTHAVRHPRWWMTLRAALQQLKNGFGGFE